MKYEYVDEDCPNERCDLPKGHRGRCAPYRVEEDDRKDFRFDDRSDIW